MEELVIRAISGQGDRPTRSCPIRFGTVNVGTISGKGSQVLQMRTCRKVHFCCLQETRWRGLACLAKGKDSFYRFFGVDISQILEMLG